MALLPFGEYRPDLSDLNADYTSSIQNVVPHADGYGPFPGIRTLTATLPGGVCKGGFYARKSDGSIAVFAGTSTNLYLLDNSSLAWTLVSKGGASYSPLSSTSIWQFEQFNSFVIAVQGNCAPQVYNLNSSTAFADLGGSPPQASYVAVVSRFVLLSGLTSYPWRIQWSGLNDPANWTPGINCCDYQEFPDGGIVRGAVGGEMGYVFQDQAIRNLVFMPGSDVIFGINRVAKDIGLLCPYTVVSAGDDVFFLSAKGFQRLAGGALMPIGREKVDRTFFADFDASQPQLAISAHDPAGGRIFWAYNSMMNTAACFDKALVYDPFLDRWASAEFRGQHILSLARPGITLESLDAIAPGEQPVTGAVNNGSGLIRLTVGATAAFTTNQSLTISGVGGVTAANGTWLVTVIDGTHLDLQGSTFSGAYTSGGIVGGSIDAITFSFDDVSAATSPQLGIFDETGSFGFFSGNNLEATMQTGEQSAIQQRMFLQGFYPVTDAPTVYGNVVKRENLNTIPTYTPEQPMNGRGLVPARADTRYSRGRVRIPAGTVWTVARGIDPLTIQRGRR